MTRDAFRPVLVAAVWLALWAGGCAKEGDAPLPPLPPPPPLAAALSLSASADEVVLTTQWQGVSGPHTQLTRWRLPNGYLYEQTTQGVSGSQPTVVTNLAVSGTPIADRRLYGTWRVEVFLDAAPPASGGPAASLAFHLGG